MNRNPSTPGNGPRRTNGANHLADGSPTTVDPQIGIQGEVIVYEALRNAMPETVTPDTWTSELRHLAKPELGEWVPPDETTFFADFTFLDDGGVFRNWISGVIGGDTGFWPDKPIRINLEVKSTGGSLHDQFHMSDWQLEAAKQMSPAKEVTFSDGREGIDVFVLLRVYDVGSQQPMLHVVVDPWHCWQQDLMVVRAPQGLWVSVK